MQLICTMHRKRWTNNTKIGRRTGVATNNSRHVAENRIIRCSSSGTLPTLVILRRDDNERDVSVAIFHSNFCPHGAGNFDTQLCNKKIYSKYLLYGK